MIRRYIKSQLQVSLFREVLVLLVMFLTADLTVKPLHPGTDWDLLPTDWDQALVLSASTTATRSWLDSLPPPSSLCSASRPRQRDSCSTCRSRPTWPLSSATSSGSLARITFKTTVPTYKAVNGTAPTHLRALVRPHAPARALRATTSAGRYRHPWERAKVAQLSPNSSLSWRRYGGPTSLLTWGPQSQRPPASARDSRPTCSELTWTPLSLLPLLQLKKIIKMIAMILCLYVLALTLKFCAQYVRIYLCCILGVCETPSSEILTLLTAIYCCTFYWLMYLL